MKLPYREGTWFAVPLRDGGFGVGLVARAAKKKGGGLRGGTLLCYFFGPRRNDVPRLADVEILSPADAVLVQTVGDLNLIRDQWPILGELSSWNKSYWPTPPFRRIDPILGCAWRVYYSDDDPSEFVGEEPDLPNSGLESAGLLGAGAAEILLTKRLNQPPKGK